MRARPGVGVASSGVLVAILACGAPDSRPSGTGPGIATGVSAGPADGEDSDDGGLEPLRGPGDDGPGDAGPDDDVRLDLAWPDLPEPRLPIIPETCEQAAAGESTVGCRFYGVDLDSHDLAEDGQFALVVSNVQEDQPASVWVERKHGGSWVAAAPPATIEPMQLHVFALAPFHQDDSGIKRGGAYRISADVPIIAYQFNPIDGARSYLSDASMLYPAATWDSLNHVVGWKVVDDGQLQGAYATVVAAHDGTEVTITPTANVLIGPGIPPSPAGQPFVIRLDEGDVAEIMTKTRDRSLTGTQIESDVDHPVAVFAGNECTFVPTSVPACDHLEEQLAGVRRWGQRFIASRVPARSGSDPSLWHIYGSEDDTHVRLSFDPAVTGIPNDELLLDAGQAVELLVGGTAQIPGDFEILADKPIAVVNYMTGSESPGAGIGDPAMVQLSPIEQFLPRYVVLVPATWIHDFVVITRPAGATIRMDGVPIDDGSFVPTAASGYEVARVRVADGVHTLDGGAAAFSVIVVGYDEFDSYAYLGGTGTGVINPDPAR